MNTSDGTEHPTDARSFLVFEGAASRPGTQPRERPALAGAAGGEASCGRNRPPGEPAKNSGCGAAYDNKIICFRCHGTGLRPVPVGHLYLDGDPVGKPGIQGRQDPGKHQAYELGWPVLVRVAGVQVHVMDLSLPAVVVTHPTRRRPHALVSHDGCASELSEIGRSDLHATMIAPRAISSRAPPERPAIRS